MSDNSAEVKITGDAQGAEAAMLKAKQSVEHGVEGMKSSLEKLQSGFEKISQGFIAFSAVMAGGSALKEFVSSANESVKEAKTLGATLGITATEASYLKVALGEAHVSQDAMTSGASKITKALLNNEDSFKKLGVATRDSNGNFRSTYDVMTETNAKLRDFKEGTDRNVEGMKIYGRSWSEIAPLVAKFKGISEETRKTAEDLNLVIGQEAVKASKDYSDSQQGVKDVFEGVSNTIGQAILPRLTELGNWFRSVGPSAVAATRAAMQAYLVIQDAIADSVKALWSAVQTCVSSIGRLVTSIFGAGGQPASAMDFFKNCLRVVEVAFIGLRVGVEIAAQLISTSIDLLVSNFQTFAECAKAALHLDWDGFKSAAERGTKRIEDILKGSIGRMKDIATKGGKDISDALVNDLGKAGPVTATEKKTAGANSDGTDPKADKDDTKKWDTENQNAKMAWQLQYDLQARALEDDVAYWEEKLALSSLNAVERLSVTKKLEEAEIALKKQAKATELALGKLDIDEAKGRAEAQLAIEAETARAQCATGEITYSELLAIQLDFERRHNAIVKESIDAEMDLYAKDPARTPQGLAALNAKLEAQERQHQNAMLQIALQQHTAELSDFNIMQSHIVSLGDAGIKSLMNGTLTWKNAYKGILGEMTGAFQDYAKEKLATWITTEKLQSAATDVENEIRSALVAAGLIDDTGATVDAASVKIGANAVAAGAGAAASQASIPIVGPILAIAAMGAMIAAVSSQKSKLSSSPGHAVGAWSIPSDGITKVHQGESILNATDSENFRKGRLGGGGGGDTHLHVNAIDAHSVKRLFTDHASTLISVLKNKQGKFAI